MIVYYNNGYQKHNEIPFDVMHPHMKFGFGFFETLLYNGVNICHLEKHVSRLESSLSDFGFKIYSDSYGHIIKEVLQINKLNNRMAKVNMYALVISDKTYRILIKVEPYQIPELTPVSLSISPHVHLSYLNRYKTMNYMHFTLARQFATAYGKYDALLCDSNKNILECTTSAILFHDGQQLFTSKDTNRLNSISLDVISERFDVEKINIHADSIKKYKNVFIVNSLMGCLPVGIIDEQEFAIDTDTAQSIRQLIMN